MPLTDDEIRAIKFDTSSPTIAELCTRVLDAEAMVRHGDIKDTADYLVEALEQQEKEALQERVKVLEDALREIAGETELTEFGGPSGRWASRRARKALERTTNAND